MRKRTEDPENPELGDDFFARAQFGLDHVPGPMRNALIEEQARRRGRGPQRAPTKRMVTLRLDPDVVAAFRKTGRGWQGRINAVLRKSVTTSRSGTPTVHPGALDTAAPARHVVRRSVVRRAAKKR